MRLHLPLPIALGALLLGLAPAGRAGVFEDLLQTLDAHASLVLTQQVTHAGLEAAARVIDPQARLLATADTARPLVGEPLIRDLTRWTNGLLWVRFGDFNTSAGAPGLDALHAALRKAPTGVLLDLRGTGGNDLDAMEQVAALLVPAGDLLYRVVDRHGATRFDRLAPGPGPAHPEPPMTLLIDGKTDGVAALLAGLLRNRAGLMLIGATTGGDSAYRERVPLTPDWDLYVATGWILPAGRDDYYARGVPPHLALADPPTPPPPTTAWPGALEGDPALRRAVDVLLALHALRRIAP